MYVADRWNVQWQTTYAFRSLVAVIFVLGAQIWPIVATWAWRTEVWCGVWGRQPLCAWVVAHFCPRLSLNWWQSWCISHKNWILVAAQTIHKTTFFSFLFECGKRIYPYFLAHPTFRHTYVHICPKLASCIFMCKCVCLYYFITLTVGKPLQTYDKKDRFWTFPLESSLNI